MSSAKDFFIEFPAGTDVFNEGETGTESYIVETGHIDLVRENGDPVASIGPGEFFGEAALTDKPHAVSARASVKSRVLRIERAAFSDVVKQNPEIAVRVLKQVIERLSHAAPAPIVSPPPKVVEPAKAAPPPPAPKPVESAKPVAPPPAPKPVEPPKASMPPPAAASPSILQQKTLALRPAGQDQVITIDATRNDFLIGRPDPATGIEPEINLGPFDTNRTLSRKHARISREGSLYFLQEENGVANGTHLNGERLPANTKVPIKPGDKLRFGLIEVDLISV